MSESAFPREHGPECAAGLVHVLRVNSSESRAGKCVGCKRVLSFEVHAHPPRAVCSACESAPWCDEYSYAGETFYDTEVWVTTKTESQQGAKLFGWGRK